MDRPRSGAPRQITEEQVEALVARTLGQPPPSGDSHWSRRSMTGAEGMSQSTVSRIWRAFGLKPHIVETWKLSTDPQFVAKVRDVVGIYLSPPEYAQVLTVARGRRCRPWTEPSRCCRWRRPRRAKMTSGYVRHGTTSLFAALDITSGSVIAQHYRRHRHQEFLRFLKVIDAAVPKDLELHLIPDDYATHRTEPVKKRLMRRPRFRLHFTSASWRNLVGTLVRRADVPRTPPLDPPQRPRTRTGHPQLDQRVETRTRIRSPGRNPPTTSSTPSPHTAHELTTQDTSSCPGRRRR
ncbi:IS630 family transposase [Streptomyces sp. 549]|uniref:IS630 family transposase n=1 Tax=Streptomyces sp. 549 TaxID=3049076 RepID=UPI0024C3E4D5|nr:IS630 family transposase [Streptomyces sp. 549]MDK1471848.1 IS630 family transposase [Streptomyces sp. 549]